MLHSVVRKVADDVKVAKKRTDASDAGGADVIANCKVVALIEEIAGAAMWSDEVTFASFDVYDAVSSDVVWFGVVVLHYLKGFGLDRKSVV